MSRATQAPQHQQTPASLPGKHTYIHCTSLSLEQTWFTFTLPSLPPHQSPPQGLQPSYPAHLGEERPLLPLELQAVGQQASHGFGAVTRDFAEVRRQIATAHHKDNLGEDRIV